MTCLSSNNYNHPSLSSSSSSSMPSSSMSSYHMPSSHSQHESFSPDSPYPLTAKDYYHASMAATEANNSTMASRHGCVATCGNGKVLASASNCIRGCSKEGFLSDQCSCHAEIHALRKLYYSHVQSSVQTHRKRYCVLQFQKNEGFL